MKNKDMLLYNGKIYIEKGRYAQALLIHNGMISAVGSNNDILSMNNDAELIDLDGKTVIPGFVDSHMHLYNVGCALLSIQLHGSTSMQEIIDRSRDFIAGHNIASGSIVVGRGWNHDYFTDEKRMPNRFDLDKVSTDHAIIITRTCGHMLSCNTKALEMAGITAKTAQIDGGEFEIGPDGKPNGIFKEHAMDMIQKLVITPDFEQSREIIKAAMTHASSHGITSVQTNDMYEDNYQMIWNAYQSLVDDGTASVRIYHQCNFSTVEGYEKFMAKGFRTGFGSSMNKIGPLKLFSDGSLGARTALMRQDYADESGTKGIMCITPDQLDDFLTASQKNGMQVVIHAIGDRAIEMVLDAYGKVLCGSNPMRHAIVHCQITDTPLLERFTENHIAGLIQPIFLHYDMHIAEDRVGKQLASTSYAFGTMDKLGIHTSYGTDSPVESLNAMENLYCAVTRKDLSGFPDIGWMPDEAVSVETAVDHYTVDGAWNSFEENIKGRLLPGYYADLAVLSDDIFTICPDRIKDIKVEMTIMNGKIVYKA